VGSVDVRSYIDVNVIVRSYTGKCSPDKVCHEGFDLVEISYTHDKGEAGGSIAVGAGNITGSYTIYSTELMFIKSYMLDMLSFYLLLQIHDEFCVLSRRSLFERDSFTGRIDCCNRMRVLVMPSNCYGRYS